MSAPIRITQAADSDAAAIAALLVELGHEVDVAGVASRLVLVRGLAPPHINLVAHAPAGPVGFLSAFVTHVLHRPQPVGRISALVVTRNHVGTGIGSALVAAAHAALAALGCSRVEVTSALHRNDAHAFYKARGYARQGVRFARDLERSHGHA